MAAGAFAAVLLAVIALTLFTFIRAQAQGWYHGRRRGRLRVRLFDIVFVDPRGCCFRSGKPDPQRIIGVARAARRGTQSRASPPGRRAAPVAIKPRDD